MPETDFDAISSIGITEHIGKANVPGYFAFLNGKLKAGGRMLNHCITRPDNTGPSIYKEGFINRYVFPDGELEGPGWLAGVMNDNGFEIRHEENLREHYSKTLAAWCANLDAHWDEAVAEVGQGTARVWRLYMAGCSSASTATSSSSTRSSASSCPRTGPQGCRCGPTGSPRWSARGRRRNSKSVSPNGCLFHPIRHSVTCLGGAGGRAVPPVRSPRSPAEARVPAGRADACGHAGSFCRQWPIRGMSAMAARGIGSNGRSPALAAIGTRGAGARVRGRVIGCGSDHIWR